MVEHIPSGPGAEPMPPVAALDADATLDRVSRNRRRRELLEADELACAAHWAELHAECSSEGASTGMVLPGAERKVELGGEGTPLVAEFAPAELGAVLGVSSVAARFVMADALDLTYRLPRLWKLVQRAEVKAWVARKVAQRTRELTLTQAQAVDAVTARYADRLTWTRLEPVVEAAVIAADPGGAAAEADAQRHQQGVWVARSHEHGTRSVFARADAATITFFDAAIDRIADGLALLGNTTDKDQRRADALGILADPNRTLDLYSAAANAAGAIDPAATRVPVDSRPPATLYVHVSPETLSGQHPVARVEGLGPVVADTVRRWLSHGNVTVKPVIDLNGTAPVDAYEIPDRLREAVHLISPADTFPFAGGAAVRGRDLDHTVPYDPGGPPGQTRVGNLAPMTRYHHRVKTHGDWDVRQPFPGVVIWRSPNGRHYLVDPTGTRPICQ